MPVAARATKIKYNFLNLPERVNPEISGVDTIKFIYDATGVKWQKISILNGVTTTTDYIGNFIYNGVPGSMNPDYVLTDEGTIDIPETGDPQYHYFLKDHLGNTRATITDADGDNILDNNSNEILQTADYYPFGLKHGRMQGGDNKYLYNGKEIQEESIGGVGLDWYDYGARFYDPSLGRFHTLDPIAPFIPGITLYNYAFNNPINLIDLEGLISDDHGPVKRDRKHKRSTRRRNIKSKFFNIFNIPHDAMANVYRQRKNKGKFSSNPSSSGSSKISSPDIKTDIDYTGLDFGDLGPSNDRIETLNIPPTSGGHSSNSNSIEWNNRIIDVAGQIDFQIDRE